VSRVEAWLFHVANVLVASTGLVYAWMRYIAVADDPYAIVNHPLQPTLQHAHVLVAPLLVFMGGIVWTRHAWSRLRSGMKSRRASGIALIATLAPMVASGYLLQTATDEPWRTIWLGVHLGTSGLWIVGTIAHLVTRTIPQREVQSSASTMSVPTPTRG
jgi:hypothetical protein